MLANRLPSTRTLAEAVSQWEKAATQADAVDKTTPVRLRVDPALAEKPICLFGASYSKTDSLARSVVALYGLELLIPKERQYYIALPIARTPQTGVEFQQEMRRLIPAPLRQQYAGLSATLAAALPPYQPIPGMTAEMIRGMQREQQKSNIFQGAFTAVDAGYYPAARRVLVLAKPLVPTPASPPVPVTKANPEVLRLIALLLFPGDCRRATNNLAEKPLAQSLLEPETLCIKATQINLTAGGALLRFYFGDKDAAGEFRCEAAPMMRAHPPTTP